MDNNIKTCHKCGIPKILDEYSNNKQTADGKSSWCKQCSSDNMKKYYQENKEKCKKYIKEYQQQHKDKVKEYTKKWNDKNKEKNLEYIRRWQKNNPEKRREWKRNWDRNRALDPAFRLSNNIRGNMYHALKAKKGFRKWEDLVGYTLQDLINHLTPLLTEGMTWDNYGNTWQVDHVKPKSWFKYESSNDTAFKECWALSNLQPMFKIENIKKGNRFEG